MLDFLGKLMHYLDVALGAIDSLGMTIAIVIAACILAAAAGLVSARMRLYGAIVGGMIMNIVVKAEGGGYFAALAAMLLVTGLAFAVGSTSLLAQVMKSARNAKTVKR